MQKVFVAMKWLKWTAIGIGAAVVLVLVACAWLLNTQSGARSAVAIARNVLGDKLQVGAVEGKIAGPLTIADLQYRDPAVGIDMRARRIALDVELTDLLHRLVRIRDARLDGIDVALMPRTRPEAAESKPFTLQPPIDMVVDSLAVNDVRIRREQATIFDVITAAFAGHWTQADLAVQRLDLRSSQGEVHFAGRVAQQRVYVGQGKGRFRWTVGTRTYAGSIESVAAGNDAMLNLRLTAPLNAQVYAGVEQTKAWPWRFTLNVPQFDPRENLMPGGKLYSLAAALKGSGTLEQGAVTGTLQLNGEPLHLDPLKFARDPQKVAIDTLVRIGEAAGTLQARGDIMLAQQPVRARIDANWREVVVPAVWAGQELHTHGQLKFDGSAEAYTADGNVTLGPGERPADIALRIEGSPQRIQLHRFDIVQKPGLLAATGQIELKPRIAWQVDANGKDFDPGAFAVAWPGKIGFDLATSGEMTPAGPSATLQLAGLSGQLRGRAVSGRANLALSPALVPSGTLELRSGRSLLTFKGERGDRIEAAISLAIASLNDLLPDAAGELDAELAVRGMWPELTIDGHADGSGLRAMNAHLDRLVLDANVDNPRDPEGSVDLELTGLGAAGFEFTRIQARMSGGLEAHEFELRAAGEPLGLELGWNGGRTDEGWAGSVNMLTIDVKDAARLALREPARVVVGEKGTQIARSCLAGNGIELCAGGAMRPDGSMEANYSVANVPLGLANVLALSQSSIRVEGTIGGRGEIRRTREGALFGDAVIQSPAGQVSRRTIEGDGEQAEAEPQTLLSYRELSVVAKLSGPDARASLSAQLQNGSLRGEGNVRGLDQLESPIAGQVTLNLPDLAPFGVLAPQLANLKGRADAHVRIAGTVQAPQITGELDAAGLAADIPALGLHLTDGNVRAQPTSTERIGLAGGFASGPGRVTFGGHATPTGSVDLKLNGERVLAANIPAARVFVTPDLTFVREGERMRLTGKVDIPEASIDLQKLPRGRERAQKASSDVVVIDAKTRPEEVAELPLFAELTITLGEKVEVTGFGLQAQMQGRLDVRESPGEPTLGAGEVRVAGKYKAYGQDLTIQHGQILYASTPLDNPQLNIEATRKVEQVTAGLRIRGNAQNPELTIFSDPSLPQAEALAYLVTGKPLDSIGADDAEGDAIQTAARSLGTAAGGLLAKTVGRRLGVDELSVKEEEMIGGAALTVGQYLSPRLYLSYGVGLFEPGDVVTLRYKLSKELAVQTQRGPEDTRAGIEYRIEK